MDGPFDLDYNEGPAHTHRGTDISSVIDGMEACLDSTVSNSSQTPLPIKPDTCGAGAGAHTSEVQISSGSHYGGDFVITVATVESEVR